MKDKSAPAVEAIRALVRGKRVLFLTTKNLDYLRNVQEIALLREAGSLDICGYTDKSYPVRLLKLFLWLLIHSTRTYDLVFLGFAPQLILPFWDFKFRRAAVVIDFFISLYDTLVEDRKKFSPGSLPAKLLHGLDARTIRRADWVVADTQAHGAYFQREFGLPEEKTLVLYLEADTVIYAPQQVPPAERDPRFTVLYFGSVLPLQGVEVILDCIAAMADTHPDIAFVFIGPLSSEAQRERITGTANVTLHPWLSQQELARAIAASDLCLAGHFNANIAKASRTIPGKAYIYRAMGKPMILGENPANRELFAEDAETFFVKMGDAEALERGILEAQRVICGDAGM